MAPELFSAARRLSSDLYFPQLRFVLYIISINNIISWKFVPPGTIHVIVGGWRILVDWCYHSFYTSSTSANIFDWKRILRQSPILQGNAVQVPDLGHYHPILRFIRFGHSSLRFLLREKSLYQYVVIYYDRILAGWVQRRYDQRRQPLYIIKEKNNSSAVRRGRFTG